MRRLAFFAVILACGPGPATSDATGTASTGAAETTASMPAGSTGPGPTTGAPDPTSAAATASGEPDTGTAPGTTGEPGTTTSASGTTAAPGTSGPDTTTGEPGAPNTCNVDADCKLHDDCCTCEGVPVGADPASCDLECKQSHCSMLGIQKAVCRLGVCITERLLCDERKVLCEIDPPECPPGELPLIDPPCWSDKCVPAEFCDMVPGCDWCAADRVCVQHIGRAPEPNVACEPRPPGCGESLCDCVGDEICTDIYECSDAGPDKVECICPC